MSSSGEAGGQQGHHDPAEPAADEPDNADQMQPWTPRQPDLGAEPGQSRQLPDQPAPYWGVFGELPGAKRPGSGADAARPAEPQQGPPGQFAGPPGQFAAPPRQIPAYPHQSSVPYHRIMRTWTYTWWKPLVGLVLIVVTVFIGALVITTPIIVLDAALQGQSLDEYSRGISDLGNLTVTPLFLLANNLILFLLIPTSVAALFLLHRLRPRWLSSVRPGLRWGLLVRMTAAAGAVVAVVVALSLLLAALGLFQSDYSAPPVTELVAFGAVVLLTTPLQAAGEEYFFRGYLFQTFGAWVRNPWFTITATSLLFAMAHGSQSVPLFLDRFAFGVLAGWLVLRTGGLEAAIALHVVNNIAAFALALFSGGIGGALTATDAGWGLVVLDFFQLGLFGLVAVLVARRSGARSLTEGPPAPAAPPPQPPVTPPTNGPPPGPTLTRE